MQSMSKRCSIFENRLYSCIHLQWLTTIRHMGQWKPVSFIFRSGFRVRCAHFDSFHALQLVATILVCIIVSWQYARLRLPTTFGNFVQGKRSNYCLIRWLHAKWIRFGWFLGIHRCRVYGFKYQQKTWIVHSFIGSIQLQEAVKSSDGNISSNLSSFGSPIETIIWKSEMNIHKRKDWKALHRSKQRIR